MAFITMAQKRYHNIFYKKKEKKTRTNSHVHRINITGSLQQSPQTKTEGT